MLNPRHRSAHEHLGEAYLVLGESAKAEATAGGVGKPLPHSVRGIRRSPSGPSRRTKGWAAAESRSDVAKRTFCLQDPRSALLLLMVSAAPHPPTGSRGLAPTCPRWRRK